MVVFPSGIVSERLLFEGVVPPAFDAGIGHALPSLVLTGHEPLRERLRLITETRGCVCRMPATLEAAWRELGSGPRLAFIDIAHPLDGRPDDTRAITEVLARRPGVMLVVCGSPTVAPAAPPTGDDERWARQMGAFVYLPGVGTNAGLALIVDEARRLFSGKR